MEPLLRNSYRLPSHRNRHRLAAVACAGLLAACGGNGNNDGGGNDVPGGDAGDAVTGDTPGGDSQMSGGGTAVTTFQFDPQRTGANRTERALTVAAVSSGRFGRDTAFAPTFDGQIYAQPLYLPGLNTGGAVHDVLFVTTQNNTVFAIDAASGAAIWNLNLGTPVAFGSQSCGNIRPQIGIVGTPVIDRASNTMYVVSFNGPGRTFNFNAIDLTTGMLRSGSPRAITPTSGAQTLDTSATGERGALNFIDGRVYVPFGGLYGDCGNYHGWVVGIDPANPGMTSSFATTGRGSGIWAVAGTSYDGAGHLFAATGNGFSATSMGEYVVRLSTGANGPTYGGTPADYFTPSNRTALDGGDVDIGSVAPVVLPDHTGSSTPHLLFQAGKQGVGYLINRDNLGGPSMGTGTTREGVSSASLFSSGIYGAAGAWSNGTDVYVFVPGRGNRAMPCTGTGGVMALRLMAGATGSAMQVAWCSAALGNPSPPAISSNGNDDAILWVAGGTSFRAYSVADGMEIYNATGANAPPSVRQWTPIVVADGRVFVTLGDTVAMYRLR